MAFLSFLKVSLCWLRRGERSRLEIRSPETRIKSFLRTLFSYKSRIASPYDLQSSLVIHVTEKGEALDSGPHRELDSHRFTCEELLVRYKMTSWTPLYDKHCRVYSSR